VLPIRCVPGRRHRALSWVGFSLLVSQVALAEPATIFEVPAACGNEAEFRRELVALTGKDADRAWPSTVRIEPAAPDGGYRLTLELAAGRRELEHLDCRVLFRSALVIAAASVGSGEASEPAGPAHGPSAPSADDARSTRTRPQAQRALRGTVALGSGIALGVVPGPTAAFEARLGGDLGPLGASVAVRHFVSRHAAVGGRGADIGGYGLRVAALYAPLPWLAGSLGLDADWLVGRGTVGIAVPLEDSAWTLAPSLELALIPVRTRLLSLEVAAAGRLAVKRPVFEVTGFGEIFRPPAGSLISVARGVFHFP
jgi:hypothetical protein